LHQPGSDIVATERGIKNVWLGVIPVKCDVMLDERDALHSEVESTCESERTDHLVLRAKPETRGLQRSEYRSNGVVGSVPGDDGEYTLSALGHGAGDVHE
jgi:hypothetical protein